MEMDYIPLCKNFYTATNIPVTLMKDKYVIYNSFSDINETQPFYYREDLFPIEHHNPCFCGDSPDIGYGRVKVEGTEYDLILGPVFSIPVTEELARQVAREWGISLEYREQFVEFLYAIPRLGQMQFACHLVFLHQCLNHKAVAPEQLFLEEYNSILDRKERQTGNIIEDREENNTHNNYYFEMQLYQFIKKGNASDLKKFLAAPRPALKEGKMAGAPLRHAKNVFIGLATKSGLLGAIPGGMDIETTYQLIDYYVQECEQLRTIEKVNQLQFVMLLDFCQRVGENHIPDGISQDVYECMNYIRNHTNESISVEDAASHVKRSSSYLRKHFKNELGIQINAYIMLCKLEEAKSLLTYSKKTLAEISDYLCFSSQSYFQNVFKKQYGITPLQYRKQTTISK